jgi:hypothetical protein
MSVTTLRNRISYCVVLAAGATNLAVTHVNNDVNNSENVALFSPVSAVVIREIGGNANGDGNASGSEPEDEEADDSESKSEESSIKCEDVNSADDRSPIDDQPASPVDDQSPVDVNDHSPSDEAESEPQQTQNHDGSHNHGRQTESRIERRTESRNFESAHGISHNHPTVDDDGRVPLRSMRLLRNPLQELVASSDRRGRQVG